MHLTVNAEVGHHPAIYTRQAGRRSWGAVMPTQPARAARALKHPRAGLLGLLVLLAGCGDDAGSGVAAPRPPVPVAPTVELTASREEAAVGEQVQLSWRADHAEECFASGGWEGRKPLSGRESVSLIAAGEQVFSLTCATTQLQTSDSVTLRGLPAPSLDFTLTATRLLVGELVTLQWVSTDAEECLASGDAEWSGTRALSGQVSLAATLGLREFRLQCRGPGGQVVRAVTLEGLPAPTLTLEIAASQIELGQSTQLIWNARSVSGCVASDGWSGPRAANGQEHLRPSALGAHRYTLSCDALLPGRAIERSVELEVTDPLAQAKALFEQRQQQRQAAGLGDES